MNYLLKAGQPGRSSCPQRHLTDLFKLISTLLLAHDAIAINVLMFRNLIVLIDSLLDSS